MWNWLWILPVVFFVWAMVLVVKKVRREGKHHEDKPRTIAQRLAELADEEGIE